MKNKKLVFEGYTTKAINPCWTVYNTFNLAAVVQKTKNEAIARYDNGRLAGDIQKIRITIESIDELPKLPKTWGQIKTIK